MTATGDQQAAVAGVRIRDATEKDGVQVCEVFRASRAEAMPWLPILHTAAEDLAFFTGLLGSGTAWVATSGPRLVGFAICSPGWLDHLYLDPAWQGRGVGSRLIGVAKHAHPGGLDLWVFERNARARRFYQRHGFVEVRQTDGSGNEEREPDILMHWSDG